MTSPLNLDLALPGPTAGLPLGFNVYGSRSGGPVFAAFPERAREPLASASDFGVAPWALTGLILVPGAEVAPDGGAADVLYETAANEEHRATVTLTGGTALHGRQYVFGAYVKAVGTLTAFGVSYSGGAFGGSAGAFVDAASGRLSAPPRPDLELGAVSSHVLDVGGGWYRLSVYLEFTNAVDALVSVTLSVRPGSASGAYLGDAAAGLAVWGAWLSEGAQRGVESFEAGWDGNEGFSLAIVAPTLAVFDTGLIDDAFHQYEGFEYGWDNFPFSTHELVELAVFNEGGSPVVFEDFEHGWPADDYAQALAPHITALSSAAFDPGAQGAEGFESGWDNGSYSTTITAQTTAQFGEVPDAFESFEDVLLDRLVVVLNDVELLCPAHGLTNGMTGYLRPQVGGVQVGNTYANVKYFIVDAGVDPDRFSLSTTEGGGPVTLLDGGVGDQFFKGDPTRYWTSADGDPLI